MTQFLHNNFITHNHAQVKYQKFSKYDGRDQISCILIIKIVGKNAGKNPVIYIRHFVIINLVRLLVMS